MSPETTQTGIPIIDCDKCGNRHPQNRAHCILCGTASLFIDGMGFCIGCAA